MPRSEKAWAIVGKFGLYVGHALTRRDAIYRHCSDLGHDWRYCYAKGDRAVRVRITVLPKRATKRRRAK